MEVRPVDEGDLDLICRHREAMFREAGRVADHEADHEAATLQTMTEHFRTWLQPRLRDGTYFGFVPSEHGAPVAGIGLMVIDWPPHPLHPQQDVRGYVLNVYVEPAARRRGLARELMRLADAEFVRRGVRYAILHSTDQGRSLYEGLGWKGTTEMARRIAD